MKFKKSIIFLFIIFIIFNIYIFFTYSTHIINYFLNIDFYTNVRYASKYAVNCSLHIDKENKDIQIHISGNTVTNMSIDRYYSYNQIVEEVSNYLKKHEKKFNGYKINIEFWTRSNINNMYLYNFNFNTNEPYDHIYDFNYMKTSFCPYEENDTILDKNLFSSIQDIYIYDLFSGPINTKESLYFLNSMDNLKSLRTNFNLYDERYTLWLNYIKEVHPSCEIICSR